MQEQLSRSGSFANLANRLTKAGPMSEAIALGLAYDWRFDLVRSGVPAVRRFGFNFTPE
jgi:hypothetical protein